LLAESATQCQEDFTCHIERIRDNSLGQEMIVDLQPASIRCRRTRRHCLRRERLPRRLIVEAQRTRHSFRSTGLLFPVQHDSPIRMPFQDGLVTFVDVELDSSFGMEIGQSNKERLMRTKHADKFSGRQEPQPVTLRLVQSQDSSRRFNVRPVLKVSTKNQGCLSQERAARKVLWPCRDK